MISPAYWHPYIYVVCLSTPSLPLVQPMPRLFCQPIRARVHKFLLLAWCRSSSYHAQTGRQNPAEKSLQKVMAELTGADGMGEWSDMEVDILVEEIKRKEAEIIVTLQVQEQEQEQEQGCACTPENVRCQLGDSCLARNWAISLKLFLRLYMDQKEKHNEIFFLL